VAQYGYQHLSVFGQSSVPGLVGAEVLYSDVDPGALDQFQRASSHHPVFVHAARTNEPFAHSEVDVERDDGDPELLDRHLYSGETLIVPVANGSAAKGVAVLSGDKPDFSPVSRSLVQVATETAFDRARALPTGDPGPSVASLLSPRETAILSWAAAGKTDADIGGLLKISARTVRFHTDNAKRKLRVTTRIQAVTESLRLGLIKL